VFFKAEKYYFLTQSARFNIFCLQRRSQRLALLAKQKKIYFFFLALLALKKNKTRKTEIR